MPISVSFLTLKVSNLKKAITFYTKLWSAPVKLANDGMAIVELENLRLGLVSPELIGCESVLNFLEGQVISPGVLMSVNVDSKAEVDRLTKIASEAGGKVIHSPTNTSWGSYAGFFADPDGHHWEVSWHSRSRD